VLLGAAIDRDLAAFYLKGYIEDRIGEVEC
jgi:hypothetical protein